MKFVALKLENWLIFKGTQELRFPQDDTRNILLVFGENMHGKTTLLNAIRWVMYGEAINRQNKPIDSRNLLNREAEKEGENKFSVQLFFEVDGDEFEIKREAKIKLGASKSTVLMKKNHRVITGGDVEQTIEALIPNQISKFLLFDGELLNTFEQLVIDQEGPQATAIKNSIEKALGLPTLRRAYEELVKFQKSSSKRFQTEMKKNQSLKMLAFNLERHENDLVSKREEKKELEDVTDNTRRELAELDDYIEKNNANIRSSEKKSSIEKQIKENKAELENLKSEIKSGMANLWRDLLNKTLSPYISDLKKEIQKLDKERDKVSMNKIKLAELNASLKDGFCSACQQTINSKHKEKINEEIKKLTLTLKKESLDTSKIIELQKELHGLTSVKNLENSSGELKFQIKQQEKLIRKNVKLGNELSSLQQELAEFSEDEGKRIRLQHDLLIREQATNGANYTKIEEDIYAIEHEIENIKNHPDYKKSIKKDDAAATELSWAEQMQEIFNSAMLEYRNSMRENVEKRASQTFGQLTTEQDFDELKINQAYGLNLVLGGEEVSIRSAGCEQVIALSLIESLNYHGRRKGPMLMDTPLARLDKSHRKNIMTYLPKEVTQLAVFAHSGEIEMDNLYFDASIIGKRYCIKRVGSYHAELEEV